MDLNGQILLDVAPLVVALAVVLTHMLTYGRRGRWWGRF